MDNDKTLAVMGSPGCGKTTTAIKSALTLAAAKKNVIVVFCDPFTPVIPAVLPADTIHDTSLGSLLTAPSLSQTDILNACVPLESNEYISFLGYQSGESLMNYPKITRDKVVDFFVMLRYLADYIIIDCSSVFEADPTSIIGIEIADKVLKMGSADLKGISYYQTHNPMMADSRFQAQNHQTVIGDLKVGQDSEAVSQQYGGVDYVLPHIVELEQQYNELTLFKPLTEKESTPYTAEIEKILGGVFSLQGLKTAAKAQQSSKTEKKAKGKTAFKLPFSKSKGEF
ncbi:MAG: ParA family protein [Angelakisella sp.]